MKFPEEQQRENGQNPPDYRFSVYTIENGRRTLINYQSDMPPRTPAHLVLKDQELPPTYDDALKMEQLPVSEISPPVVNTTTTTGCSIPRRNSAAL